MKVSNFRDYRESGNFRFAAVDVKHWFRTKRRIVYRTAGSNVWSFMDTGEYTPGYEVERMERAQDARKEYEKL